MRILTSEQMRNADRHTIEEFGVPGIVLMENAAIRVVESLKSSFSDLPGKRVGIFAGKGNNGGDGLAVSRHLKNLGVNVTVYLLGKKSSVSGDALLNLNIAGKLGIPVHETLTIDTLRKREPEVRHLNIVIDAILGTGTNKAAGGFFSEVISFINSAGKFTLSIDLPSGLLADTGMVPGNHIRAYITTALQSPKICHYQYPAADSCGRVEVCDIGIPPSVINKKEHNIHLVSGEMIRKIILPRRRDTHKGTYGHLLCVCGSTGKGGAAGLAASAAYRAGAGLVTLVLPASLNCAFENGLPEVMTIPAPETTGGTISDSACDLVMKHAEGKAAVLLGPGLTTDSQTSSLVTKVITSLKKPLILDADALNIVAKDTSILKEREAETILTPHPGEMARLCGVSTDAIQNNRVSYAKELSLNTRSVVVLKGAGTIVSLPDGTTYINSTGNPGMASGGTGDVLAGIIAGFRVQGYLFRDSAVAGVYIHGLAGDIAAGESGEHSFMAGDLLSQIGQAVKQVFQICES